MVQHYDHDTEPTPHRTVGRTDTNPDLEPANDRQPAHRAEDRPMVGEVDPAYRGFKFGAAFFGWLIAVAITVLLAGVIGAVTATADYTLTIDWTAVREDPSTVGVASAVVLLAVMLIAYYTGGYVAGRLARFDGARQGIGVWVIGLLTTLLVGALGTAAGSEYNVLERADLPTIPWSDQQLTTGGIVLALALVLVTLLAAIVGGKAGQRYHRKIDASWS